MRAMEERKVYDSVDDLYRERVAFLIAHASRHLINRDCAIDVVHDVLAESVKYFNNNPGKRVSEKVIRLRINEFCKKYNKKCTVGVTSLDGQDQNGFE